MARLGRLVSWAAVALAVPATVAFSPVHPAEAPHWEPQLVADVHPVDRALPSGLALIPNPGPRAFIAVQAALTRLGDPYVWAAAGPHAFDCSGLVVWSFQQAGLLLPHSSQMLAAGGQPVSPEQIRPVRGGRQSSARLDLRRAGRRRAHGQRPDPQHPPVRIAGAPAAPPKPIGA